MGESFGVWNMGADADVMPWIRSANIACGFPPRDFAALQTTVNLMMGDEEAASPNRRLILDVERYRARREEQVRELAQRLADRVKASGERYTPDPMHAAERRSIHPNPQATPGVRTDRRGSAGTQSQYLCLRVGREDQPAAGWVSGWNVRQCP